MAHKTIYTFYFHNGFAWCSTTQFSYKKKVIEKRMKLFQKQNPTFKVKFITERHNPN